MQSAPASLGHVAVAAPPQPPSVHWAVVALLWIPTVGIFGLVTIFRQALWARRADPDCKAAATLAIGLALSLAAEVLSIAGDDSAMLGVGLLFRLMSIGLCIWSYFQIRDVIEDRYGVHLSGVMTFFFNVFYFQYHLRRIVKGDFVPQRTALLH
jgi:hypothetical protein